MWGGGVSFFISCLCSTGGTAERVLPGTGPWAPRIQGSRGPGVQESRGPGAPRVRFPLLGVTVKSRDLLSSALLISRICNQIYKETQKCVVMMPEFGLVIQNCWISSKARQINSVIKSSSPAKRHWKRRKTTTNRDANRPPRDADDATKNGIK